MSIHNTAASIFLALATLLAGCATTSNNRFSDVEDHLLAGRYEAALATLEERGRNGPQNGEFRATELRVRNAVADKLIRDARHAADLDRLDDAERHYRRLLAVAPGNVTAREELERLQTRRRRDNEVAQAETLLRQGNLKAAESALRKVLGDEPRHRKALKLLEQLDTQKPVAEGAVEGPAPEMRQKVSLEFRDVSLRSVFDVIWHASGINFILDREIKPEQKASIFVRDVTVEEAIDALLLTQQLGRKQVSAKTLLIYPKTQQKLAEYQDLVVRNFFLAHADAKQLGALLKSVLKLKDIFIEERRNLLVVRDTQELVDLASKLVQAHDQQEPEVMLALDVIEVRRTKLDELGLALPGQVSFGVANPLSLAALRSLGAAGINVGFTGAAGTNMLGTLNLQKSDSDANMLANPRIRVRNREKAKIHIGDRLPVVTTTSSATSTFVGETVNYLDVGLKLEVEPQVLLEDQVVVKVNLEVSSATQSKVNAKFYDIGTRNTATVLTLRDGETQVLAGLIRDDERDASSRLPGLGDLPLLGRLFASERKEQDKTEIVLAITPQIIANLRRPSADLTSYRAGTELGGSGATSSAGESSQKSAGVAASPAPAAPQGTGGLSAPAATAVGTVPPPRKPEGRDNGVLPLIEFEMPPGVGSNAGTVR